MLWLQGGPGWPTMYGLFKENGPYLVGWDPEEGGTFLVPNKYSWTDDHHMLYIDNPVGAGFSFTESDGGYPTTDEEVSEDLLNAVRQFMKLYPYMTKGQPEAKKTKVRTLHMIDEWVRICYIRVCSCILQFYAFGESYGGAYVVSLARKFIQDRREDDEINFTGIGIGNGFISAPDQSIYADYFNSLSYVDKKQYEMLKAFDEQGQY